ATHGRQAVKEADSKQVDRERGAEVEAAPLRKEAAKVTGRRRRASKQPAGRKSEVDADCELK
ncbi:hypothetical protein, partial [Corallococcus caeni]|uniref:hypothetical protein n=1 Tax=Corallococcus caeni TaxID=3082388 RepID=UPI0030C6FF6D